MALIRLRNCGEREDILQLQEMRGADDSFFRCLKEIGKRCGVVVEYLEESGFNPEYLVRPPVPEERIEAFAGLVTASAVDALPGSFPAVEFTYQPSPSSPERSVFHSLDLVA